MVTIIVIKFKYYRVKDKTIAEYTKQIDELKNQISQLQNQIKNNSKCKSLTDPQNKADQLNSRVSEISIDESDKGEVKKNDENIVKEDYKKQINDLKNVITLLERHSHGLEQELCSRQVELSSLEEMICIRDSLCKDLQDKLSEMEIALEETKQRLEMVKGHHALALEANESIRKEYKVELESLKSKFEDEKQAIIVKNKMEQDNIKTTYIDEIQIMKELHEKEKKDIVKDLQQQIVIKENEMKAKLEQMEETTHEKLRLCEIQFEERCRNIHEHWSQQENNLQFVDNETRELKYALNMIEDRNAQMQSEIVNLKTRNESLSNEKQSLIKEIENVKDDFKRREIDFENEINKLTVQVEKVEKEKSKFECSLSVTRDIVDVLTRRLRESDSDIDILESNIASLSTVNKALEEQLATCKGDLNNAVSECNEYKDALVNILKSKAALAKEHTRIMEHNVTLIESLQNVEKEAYRELGSIKNELIEDVELLKKESDSQIKKLRDEVSNIFI